MLKQFRLLLMAVLALGLCGLPAMAGTLFSDLGPAGSVYNGGSGWTVSGTGTVGTSFSSADLFTVAGSGSLAVSQIDLAVSNAAGVNTFYATIWTDNSGTPGSQVAGASWNPLSTTTSFGDCCGLVSITGITGVSLTGGQQYFMILGPLSTSDNSWNPWNQNNQGVNGDVQYSTDGGVTWNDMGSNTTGAFDVLSATPEPGSLFLLGTGLIGMLGAFRRRSKR
jgi:hypothetical protein